MGPTSQDIAVDFRTAKRLSMTQRAFLASQLRHPESSALNMALAVEFDSVLDADRFATAFDAVVDSADVLRTRVVGDDAEIAATAPGHTDRITFAGDMTNEARKAWAVEFAQESFDLATCGYRSTLVTSGNRSIWFIAMHHLITDATSFKLVIERTIAAYAGTPPAASKFYPWAETVRRESQDPGRQQRYWDNRPSAERPGRLYQSSDRSSSQASRHRLPLQEIESELNASIASEFRMLNPELAWAAFLVTATAVYVHRLTGVTGFAVGIPVHHRNTAATAELIGPTMAVYPVDVRVEGDDTYRTLHRRVSRALMTMLSNTHPSISAPGDYDIVVNVIPNVTPSVLGVPFATTWIHPGAIDPEHVLRVQATRYDRAGISGDKAGDLGIDIDIDVHHQAATDEQRERSPEHMTAVLQEMALSPDASIFEADLCTAAELSQMKTAEAGEIIHAEPAPVVERLRTALANNPSVVVSSADEQLTGKELWDWASALAQDLEAVEPSNARIAIALGPSVEAVVAIYGCLIANRPFVPLDPLQPRSRTLELTRRAGITRTFSSCDDVAKFRGSNAAGDLASRVSGVGPADEAYLLFTSGSTGVPKGVPISNLGLARYIDFAVQSYFPDDIVAVAPLFTALTFDLTVTTLFAPIISGGRLVVLNGPGPLALTEFAATPELNWCKATPSHLEVLASLLPADHQLSVAVVGGEAFRSDLAERLLLQNPSMAVFNEYGPTEAVVGCMIHRVDPRADLDHVAVPIGRPAPGVELRVVDAGGTRVPIGVPGELWISHQGLTTGYLDDASSGDHPDRAAEQMDRAPFVVTNGVRFYASGDLVVRNADLGLTYLGRLDSQLKVGGIRLDPSEVENALVQHPAIARAAVRKWTPTFDEPSQHCVRCGLPSNVPGTVFDQAGVCNTCHDFDLVAPMAQAWFRTEAELVNEIRTLNQDSLGDYDCLHLMSGGKDSTYALYKLVELGFRPYALCLDNGFISQGALDNVRRCAEDLGVAFEFATTPQMNAIFRDSLATFSDVCHGCYKTIYTLATNRAVELNIPVIVTGLSRGQLFETRLIPGQFQQERFDPDAIDRAVVEARKRYHRTPDFVNGVLDTSVFETDQIFEDLHYVDIYRYLDVELSNVLTYLHENTPWQRPEDTGRSSNCLINIAGIHAHQVERGYHNYAEPYAWDVRLGHKQREQSIAELDDPVDPVEIAALLGAVGYSPEPKQIFTGWYELAAGFERAPTPGELRTFLSERLPQHAIPAAFMQVQALTTTANGKLDEQALPAPERQHRAAIGAHIAAESELESKIVAAWESALGIAPISVNDDFFALGGDSLAAVTMIVALGTTLEMVIREELAFAHTTPRELATAIEEASTSHLKPSPTGPASGPPLLVNRSEGVVPELSTGEMSILFHQASRPSDAMYNVCRTFEVAMVLDADRLHRAVLAAVAHHEPLTWTFGQPRQRMQPAEAVAWSVAEQLPTHAAVVDSLSSWHLAPFDLNNGPLLRCRVFPLANGTTTVAVALHHATGDVHQSLDVLWADINDHYHKRPVVRPAVGYSDFCAWQQEHSSAAKAFWSTKGPFPGRPDFGVSTGETSDGYLASTTSLSPAQLRHAVGHSGVASAVAAAAAAVSPFFDSAVEINLIASTRDHSSADRLFGYLLNPVPLLFDTSDGLLPELAAEASVAMGQHLPHRAYPFAQVVSDLRARNATPPSGGVLVAYNEAVHTEFAGGAVRNDIVFNGSAVADITFFVAPGDTQIQLGVEYRGTAVSKETAALLLERFDQALTAIALRQPVTVRDLREPAQSVLRGPELADTESLFAKFRRNTTLDPNGIAVQVGTESLTWRQLGSRATQVAAELERRNIGVGDRVAVRIGRSVELATAIVGTLLSGASYVPLDPTYPSDRIATMLQLSQTKAELTSHFDSLDPAVTSLVLTAERIQDSAWVDDLATSAFEPAPSSEAYVIFTSGSTGTPHGVAISHDQLRSSTNARSQFYQDTPDRFLMLSSVSFDSSVVGLFWTLASGATLVLPTNDAAHDIDQLHDLFIGNGPSHVLCVPTLYQAILDRARSASADAQSAWPRHVIVAGEACTSQLISRHALHAPASRLTNEYGPTEATVWATAYHCNLSESDPVPIGSPIAGTWLAVTNSKGRVQPVGVAGELVLGGPNVASGYVADATSLRFADASSFPGLPAELQGQVFRTGDRVLLRDQQVVFLGRVDDQLNIGGARVEPAEIESHLEKLDQIAQAVVVGVDVRPADQLLVEATDTQAAQAMQQAAGEADPAQALRQLLGAFGRPDIRLVAHYVSDVELDQPTLRGAVSSLPVTHRPTLFRRHDELAMLPNGKVDRSAAARLSIDLTGTPLSREPSGGGLALMQQLFAETLRVGQVTATDSFFDLGGDSLRAIELLRIVEARTGVRLSTSAIHNAPTPLALAEQLDAQGGGSQAGPADDVIVMKLQPEGTEPPVFALHNLGVDGAMWRPLVSKLGNDLPFYGLADPFALLDPFGASYNLDHRPEISETAAHYVEHIQRIAPTGPINLIGFCVGGVVGYDVAQQLAAAGREVHNFIIVLDWHAPHLEYQENWITLTKLSYRRSGKSLAAHIVGVLTRRAFLKSLRRRAEGYAVRLAQALRLPMPQRLRSRQYVEEGIHRIHSYEYQPYDGSITVVRSSEDPRIPADLGNAGWGDLVSDLDVHYVPGVGEKMLHEPFIGALADIVQESLKR